MRSILLLLFTICVAPVCLSQSNNTSLPAYMRFAGIPTFTIYKAPDSTAFTREDLKRKSTVFIVFDPDCDHCQMETKAITSNIERFKKAQIIMVTYFPHKEMLKFYRKYKIANYPIITMGSDPKFFFPIYYKVGNLPAIFVYDKNRKLKKSFAGTVSLEKIIEAL